MAQVTRRISQKRITLARTLASRYTDHQIKVSKKIEALEKELESLKTKPSLSSKFLVRLKELELKDLHQRLEAATYKFQQQSEKVHAGSLRNNSLNKS